ncbi:MAG: helix-turn-helix transcriptional regulator [Henriciella sp.]|nr:helix-turn-helix transcriptional regulator [Henriciella sp.]
MSENKLPSGIDRIVGQRLRWRRRELKLTQEQLGEKLGLTFQQVQKYEKGVNRISAGRLFEMAAELTVPITYFYEGVEDLLQAEPLMVNESDHPPTLPVIDGEAMELVTSFQKIHDPALRRSLLDAIRAAAASSEKKAEH